MARRSDGVGDDARRCQDRLDRQAILRERPGLVGDDQVDRAERLLGAQAPDQDAPTQEPVGAKTQDDRQEDRRLLGDRRDRGRDARDQVLAGRIAAGEAEPDRDRDEADGDDEEDPDEPIELALEGRSTSLGRGQPLRDAAELGGGTGGEGDALAVAADDRRPGEGDGAAFRGRGGRRIRLDRCELRDRFPGQDAAIDQQPGRPDDAQVRGDHVTRAQEDEVARHEVRCGDVVDDPVPADPRARSCRVAQCRERMLSPVARDHIRAHDREQSDEDQEAVADFTERDRQGTGHEQQDDERLRNGLEDGAQERRRGRRLQLVRPDSRSSPRDVRGRQARPGVELEGRGDIGCGPGVGVRDRPRRSSSLHEGNRATGIRGSVGAVRHLLAVRVARAHGPLGSRSRAAWPPYTA